MDRKPAVQPLLDLLEQRGEESAVEMLESIYPELRRIAARQMLGERHNHTLQATALVNEAYVRLSTRELHAKNPTHFKALLAIAMRRVLVDHARAKASAKRGGGLSVVVFDEERDTGPSEDLEVVALNAALDELATFDTRAAQVVSLHYFGGMTYAEIAELVEVSDATVHKDLRMARAWLANKVGQ